MERHRSLLPLVTFPVRTTNAGTRGLPTSNKIGGKEVDLSKATSSTKVESRDYEVIKDSDKMQGILTKDTYMCPKCDCVEVFSYLEQTRSSDEPETRMLTCKDCGHGWREY